MSKKKKNYAIDTEEIMPGQVISRRPGQSWDQVTGVYERHGISIPELKNLSEDPCVIACLRFVKENIVSMIGEYQHPFTEISDFVNEMFEKMRSNLPDVFTEALSYLEFGFSTQELIFDIVDDKLLLVDVVKIPQNSMQAKLDKGSKVEFWIQNRYTPDQAILPSWKIFHITTTREPYGKSVLEPIKEIIKSKQIALSSWKDVVSRYGSPILLYKLQNPNQKVKDSSGDICTALELAQKQIASEGELKGVALGSQDDISLIYPPSGCLNAVQEHIQYLDKQIRQGLAVPSLLLDAGQVGSYALSTNQKALFDERLKYIRTLILDSFLEQVVKPIIIANFGEQEYYGDFALPEVDTGDIQEESTSEE